MITCGCCPRVSKELPGSDWNRIDAILAYGRGPKHSVSGVEMAGKPHFLSPSLLTDSYVHFSDRDERLTDTIVEAVVAD